MSYLGSPPELISSLLRAGAGSGPTLAAATAWSELAVELESAAQAFSSTTSGLSAGSWQGSASAAMLSAATQYTRMLSAVAAQAETTAAQARTIAAEFESALAAAVQPVLVAANRDQLVELVVSNLFGQNAPLIAAIESEYEQMWAQNVAAMIAYHAGASAAAAQLSAWSANIPSLSAQVTGAVATKASAAASTAASAAASSETVDGLRTEAAQSVNSYLTEIEDDLIDVINTPTEILFGRQLISTGTSATYGTVTTTSTNGTVELTMVEGTEPVVYASVGDGTVVALLVDTGSTGLVLPYQDVGGLLGLFSHGLPTGLGIGGYSGGVDYFYITETMTVNFGSGLETQPTSVDVELFSWPTSLSSLLTNGFSFQSYFAQDDVSGVLGIGQSTGGPGPSIATTAFANAYYDEGVLIDEAAGTLTFGTAPTGSAVATLSASNTMLDITVDGVTYQVSALVDSGGVDGTILSSIIGDAATGTPVTVSTTTRTHLFDYLYDENYYPTVISSGTVNTGAKLFEEYAVYLDYADGTIVLYNS